MKDTPGGWDVVWSVVQLGEGKVYTGVLLHQTEELNLELELRNLTQSNFFLIKYQSVYILSGKDYSVISVV